jgi:hypothetical protein
MSKDEDAQLTMATRSEDEESQKRNGTKLSSKELKKGANELPIGFALKVSWGPSVRKNIQNSIV